jgi:putative intracellular protease/amidase
MTDSAYRQLRSRCDRRLFRGRQGRRRLVPWRRAAPLRYARLSTGELLAKGPTGFANVEEDFADNTVWEMGALPRGRHLMSWRIEDEMRALGANYVQAGLWRDFAVRDGNLITGQQNFS